VIHRGRIVHPTNREYNDPGGIHDDDTAQDLGFRGGTIAGSAHLDTFVPVLLDVFGPEWFRSGSISMYFRHATTDGEQTQPVVDVAAAGDSARVWMEGADGVVVGEGSAAVGTDHLTELSQRDLRHDLSQARILVKLCQGQPLRTQTMTISAHGVAEGCRKRITEPIDAYTSPNKFGVLVAPPSSLIDLFNDAAANALSDLLGDGVGMWGALEVRHYGGPLVLDRPYIISGAVVACGHTPKTEVLWVDTYAHDKETGQLTASGRVMSRFVKASSSLYEADGR
jgi:hypothetical protein